MAYLLGIVAILSITMVSVLFVLLIEYLCEKWH